MAHLTHDMKPIREEEISQVEMNEEFGLAGKMMLALLFQWLNAENRKAMDRLLRFYHPLDKAMLIYAMLLYVTTGKRVKMNNAVAQRHYNLMVEFVDDDMYTLPSCRWELIETDGGLRSRSVVPRANIRSTTRRRANAFVRSHNYQWRDRNCVRSGI